MNAGKQDSLFTDILPPVDMQYILSQAPCIYCVLVLFSPYPSNPPKSKKGPLNQEDFHPIPEVSADIHIYTLHREARHMNPISSKGVRPLSFRGLEQLNHHVGRTRAFTAHRDIHRLLQCAVRCGRKGP